jgi:hypothetical protein
VGGIARGGETRDRDTGHALQRFGHGLVREGADVGRGDRVDHRVGFLLELLRGLQGLADAGHEDFGHLLVGLGRRGLGVVRGCRRVLGHREWRE